MFKDKTIVITGGTGGIGSAIVKGFIDAGSEVLVSARDASQFDSLKEYLYFFVANNKNKISFALAKRKRRYCSYTSV